MQELINCFWSECIAMCNGNNVGLLMICQENQKYYQKDQTIHLEILCDKISKHQIKSILKMVKNGTNSFELFNKAVLNGNLDEKYKWKFQITLPQNYDYY